jgi:hypothetical protein
MKRNLLLLDIYERKNMHSNSYKSAKIFIVIILLNSILISEKFKSHIK